MKKKIIRKIEFKLGGKLLTEKQSIFSWMGGKGSYVKKFRILRKNVFQFGTKPFLVDKVYKKSRMYDPKSVKKTL